MELNSITLKAKLITEQQDNCGYIVYIFEDLEAKDSDLKYIMCTRFPNWENAAFTIGDTGYLNIRYIQAGIDKWWDGKDFVPYNYTNIQFVKFVKEIKHETGELVVD